MTEQKFDALSKLNRDQLEILSALVKSPAFHTLKHLLSIHRQQLQSLLVSTMDVSMVYRLQGRVQGLDVTVNLPTLISKQFDKMRKKEEKAKKPSP